MNADKIALYGGSFDPIHLGHLIMARIVVEKLHLERLCFVPSARPPHKPEHPLADFEHRVEMIRLAIAGQQELDVDRCEENRSGPSYTYDTIVDYRQRHPNRRVYWIIGADSLAELHLWYRVEELLDLCNVVTVCRPGWESPDLSLLEARAGSRRVRQLKQNMLSTPRIDISATDIRDRLIRGQSVRYFVPDAVLDYLMTHDVYPTHGNDMCSDPQ